jgi:hypothetical protein
MRKLLTASAAALALMGVTIGAAAPAEARYWGGPGYYGRGYYGHHGGGRTAAILGAGVLGLAAGAAIASNHPRYYAPSYYGGPVYYAPPPPPPPVYYDGYYARGPVCRSDWRWDGYVGQYVRVRYCD